MILVDFLMFIFVIFINFVIIYLLNFMIFIWDGIKQKYRVIVIINSFVDDNIFFGLKIVWLWWGVGVRWYDLNR